MFILPLIIFVLALSVYPLAYSFWLSFQEQVNAPTLHYVFGGGTQYVKVLMDPAFWKAAGVTVRFAVESVIASLLIGLGLAYLMNGAFRGRGVFRALILVPWVISEYSTGYIWNFMYQPDVGFLNALLVALGLIKTRIIFISQTFAMEAVVVAYAWHLAPLIAFFILAGMQYIPVDLERQARVDGAGFITRFRIVSLPFLRYPMLISTLLVTAYAAKTVDIIITLSGGGPNFNTSPVTNLIYLVTFNEFNFPFGAAMSFYLIALISALTTFMFIFMTRPFRMRRR